MMKGKFNDILEYSANVLMVGDVSFQNRFFTADAIPESLADRLMPVILSSGFVLLGGVVPKGIRNDSA
jgi:hypothetical protein